MRVDFDTIGLLRYLKLHVFSVNFSVFTLVSFLIVKKEGREKSKEDEEREQRQKTLNHVMEEQKGKKEQKTHSDGQMWLCDSICVSWPVSQATSQVYYYSRSIS